jgi:transcriptional regulator with XRE-family HTH domain
MTANGDLIHDLRMAQGMTQEQLAEKAGLDVKTVHNAEQGKRLDLGTLTKFGFVLQAELRHLTRRGLSARKLEIGRRDVALKWCHLWDTREMEPLLALYHDDAELHLPGGPQIPFSGLFRGKPGIRQAYEIAWNNCRTEPGSDEEFSVLVSNGTVILQGRKGVRLPNDDLVKLWCTQILTFQGDKIMNHRVEYDTLTFARWMQFPPPTDSETSR